jgi:hypothetical protein
MLAQGRRCFKNSVLCVCLALVLTASWGFSFVRCAYSQQPPTVASTLQTEESTQNVGAFGIAGENFTVILHQKRMQEDSRHRQRQTLSAIEIRDHFGSVVYQRTFPDPTKSRNPEAMVTASAELLPYLNGNLILITYHEWLADTRVATFWQAFGFIKGKLGLYAGPANESSVSPMSGIAVRGGSMGMPMAQQGDPVELRLWTGNFYVFVPMLVDWRNARLIPAQHCFESGAGAGLRERGCDMRVEAARKTSNADLGFVRVFREPEESEGGAKHVVIKKDSQVRYLAARVLIRWADAGDLIQATLPDFWLKVLVDNSDDQEGWIHTEEDLQAVGLPFASGVQ